VHPDSFTEQKKFLINPTRKQYHLKENVVTEKSSTAPSSKPAVKIPAIKKP
jgi:hypothetical protein